MTTPDDVEDRDGLEFDPATPRPTPEAIVELMKDLELDLNLEEWDRAAAVYVVHGDPDKLELDEMDGFPMGNPDEILTMMADDGMRVRDNVHALVVTLEGYRHLFFDEVMVDREEFETAVTELMTEHNLPRQKVILDMSRMYYMKLMFGPNPSELPADQRRETRLVYGATRDKVGMAVIRTRETDEVDSVINRPGEHENNDGMNVQIINALVRFFPENDDDTRTLPPVSMN